LGTFSLGSAIGTADTFAGYPVAFVLRNLFWRQGSPEAGCVYRIGKITPDALLAQSEYLDPLSTFLPSGGTGPFAIALPDSGLGVVGGVYLFDEQLVMAGLVSGRRHELQLPVGDQPRVHPRPRPRLRVQHQVSDDVLKSV
jgi:hypothetical protein